MEPRPGWGLEGVRPGLLLNVLALVVWGFFAHCFALGGDRFGAPLSILFYLQGLVNVIEMVSCTYMVHGAVYTEVNTAL